MGGRGGGGPRALSVSQAGVPGPAVSSAESAVRTAYDRLQAQSPEGWVSLTRLRQEPGVRDLPRDVVDSTLRAMNRQKGITLVPQSNQKVLTQADLAAMVDIGNETKLLMRIRQ